MISPVEKTPPGAATSNNLSAAVPLVLIVEDEEDLQKILEFNLAQAGYRTRTAGRGAQALASCAQARPDLIVLDLNLPDVSGIDVCRSVRSQPALGHIPVIMLTARASEADRVAGLEVGADDYVVKPFSVRELVLRVQALLRRAHRPAAAPTSARTRVGAIELDREGFIAYAQGKEVPLTLLEFRLLQHLIDEAGRVCTRDQLLERVWGYSTDVETRTIDTHVKRLREKIGAAGDVIETVRGMGYRIRGEV